MPNSDGLDNERLRRPNDDARVVVMVSDNSDSMVIGVVWSWNLDLKTRTA